MHEPASDYKSTRQTWSCSSSSFCSKTIMSDFPCCAARKLKNCLHFTKTSENWSCSDTEQPINNYVTIILLKHMVMRLVLCDIESESTRWHRKCGSPHTCHSFPLSLNIEGMKLNLQGNVGVPERSFWWQKIHQQRLHLKCKIDNKLETLSHDNDW